jgi:hypothetical protein
MPVFAAKGIQEFPLEHLNHGKSMKPFKFIGEIFAPRKYYDG